VSDKKKRKFNIMKEFEIAEIASVDMPAQGPGARMALMKRRTPEDVPEVKVSVVNVGDPSKVADALAKAAALTDPMDGHTHTLVLDRGEGPMTHGETSYHDDHSHPWIIGLNGELIVGASNGHTHRVGFLSKGQVVGDVADETHFSSEQMSARSDDPTHADVSADDVGIEDETMTDNDLDPKVQEQLDALTKRAERAEKMAELTDAEKAYLKGLEGDDAESFLSAENKGEIMTKAAEADPVVATVDGVEIRKSQDPTGLLTKMAKKAEADELEKAKLKEDADKERKAKEDADLEKRAEALEFLPGDVATKVAMLKAVDSIEDEAVRKSANEALIAKNAGNAGNFEALGTVGSPEVQSDDEALDALAKSEMKNDSSLSYEQAYTKALLSDAGQDVYNKRLEG